MCKEKEIVLEYEGNLPFIIFLIQNIILLVVMILTIFYLLNIKIHNENDFKIIHYFFLFLLPFSALQLITYIKDIFSFDKLIINKNSIVIDKQKYDISNIGFRYSNNGVFRSTMIRGEIFLKENDEVLAPLIFNFWAGSLLNITPYTLDKIFNGEDKEYKQDSFIVSVDLEKEKDDITNFDKSYYMLLLMFIIPALIIWFIIS